MATLLGPLAVVPGSRTATVAVPVNLVGVSGEIRVTINGVLVNGDASVTVSGSDDGVNFTVLFTFTASNLMTLNADGLGDVSVADVPVASLPAHLKLDAVSTAAFTLLVERL